MKERSAARADAILDVVTDLLQAEGYDAVQVRTVASRARISLATMYKLFGTREQLIARAVERWMEANAYAELTPPQPGESPYEILLRVLHAVFEPWEQHPRMLEAHYRLRAGPSGEWLTRQGKTIVKPLTETALKDADPQFASDLELIFSHVHRGVMARFADGEIEVTDILPILERTLLRLAGDSQLEAGRAGREPASKQRGTASGRRQRTA